MKGRQKVADAPVLQPVPLRKQRQGLRYALRAVAYRFPLLRRIYEAPSADVEWWNDWLSDPRGATWLQGTTEIEIRNSIIGALLRAVRDNLGLQEVLDVGCGAGSLCEALPPTTRYCGVDLSEVAIEEARRTHPGRVFLVSDMRAYFPPPDRFNVMVFAEMLYYLPISDAIRELRRYAEALAPFGHVVISLKDDPKSHALLKEVSEGFHWVRGVLYQPKDLNPDYKIRVSQERPAVLVCVLQVKGSYTFDGDVVKWLHGGRAA